MKIKNIIAFVMIFTFFSGSASASLSSISLFDIVEINFYNTQDIDLKSECADYCEPQKTSTEKEEIIDEEIVLPETVYILDPISKINFQNDKMYIYLGDLDFRVSKNTLYINGYKVRDDLVSERYYSDNDYNVYSLERDDVKSYIFDGYNKIYFKNDNDYENTSSYYFYYGDLFKYDGLTNLINCNGSIDRIILTDGSGDTVYDKRNQGKYHNVIYKRDNEELKKGYYSAKIYCSNDIKDLYFIGKFNYYYNSRYEQATHYTSYGDYFDKTQYNLLKK